MLPPRTRRVRSRSGHLTLTSHAKSAAASLGALGHEGIRTQSTLVVGGSVIDGYEVKLVASKVTLVPRWHTRITAIGLVTLYPDGTYVGEGDALEWLEYQEVEENPSSPLPILHRATDLPHLQRPPSH